MLDSGAASVDASTRLLRVLTLLTAQLDPVKGIDSKTARRAAEDVNDIVEEHGMSLSSDVRQLLASASSSLSPSSTSTVPYFVCLSAHLSLARALPLFADSPPTRPSPFSRLPAELVDRIVALCQGDDDDGDMRLRQNTNLALASLAAPSTAPLSPTSAGRHERDVAAVTTSTISLALSDIKLRKDGRWAGAHLVSFLRQLHNVEVLRVEFDPELSEDDTASDLQAELSDALDFGSEPGAHSTTTSRLCVAYPSPPSPKIILPASIIFCSSRRRACPVSPRDYKRDAEQRYTHLLLPWLALRPSHMLDLVRPFSNIAPQLRHLETFLVFEHDLQTTISAIEELFSSLAPTLESLVLRLDTDQDWDWQQKNNVTNALCQGLARCDKLKHLELGATSRCLLTDFGINLSGTHPPAVESIVFLLPHAMGALVDYAETRPRSVRTATLCIASPEWVTDVGFILPQVHGAIAVCAEHGLMLSLTVRGREAEWWHSLV
ncbi:hypothetical protein JCM8097_006428 [Rhodosporidiobolus ruineniae]